MIAVSQVLSEMSGARVKVYFMCHAHRHTRTYHEMCKVIIKDITDDNRNAIKIEEIVPQNFASIELKINFQMTANFFRYASKYLGKFYFVRTDGLADWRTKYTANNFTPFLHD